MGIIKDLTGQKFGKLTPLYNVGKNKHNAALWLCQCDCGNTHITKSSYLINGECKSCGCLIKEKASITSYRHGLSTTRIYKIWSGMKYRCNKNHSTKIHKNYKNKGIQVCDEWKNDFMAFYNWAMENGYQENLTIDRIDVNGNYEPDNCRWVTMKEQENNRNNNHYINYNNEIHILMEWSRILNINYDALRYRLKKGWSVEKAFTTPVRKQ